MPLLNKLLSKNNQRSLILAGGGMRLAYQGGVLIALEEQGLSFSHIDGTSGGIFNAGMLASGLNANKVAEKWRKLNIKNFMSMRPLKKYFKPLNMMGYADADGIRNKIFPDLGIDIQKIKSNQLADTTFNVCNFSNKSIESIDQKQAKEDHLVAGVSLPIVMPALKINESWYSDAVWIKDANLMEAVRRGAEELWLIWAIGNNATYLPGALNQYVHMIEMSANGGLLEEYKQISMINDLIKNNKSPYGQKKAIKLFVIKPPFPLPLDPDLFINKIDTRSLVNMGYAQAKITLISMPEEGQQMDMEATKMSSPGTRLNFRTEFHGLLSHEGKRIKTGLYTYFVFSSLNEHDEIQMFSSIDISEFSGEIPCYDHEIKISDIQDKTIIQSQCLFNFKNDEYVISATWEIESAIDFLLGLTFKKVEISIAKNSEKTPTFEGTLYQEIKERIRNYFSINIRKEDGTPGGIGLKYRMVSKLLELEK